jgi:hypothetical protein
MPNPRVKHTWVVHKSTAGILKSIPEAVDPVGNPPPALTTNTVAPLQQRVSANRRSRCRFSRRTLTDSRSRSASYLILVGLTSMTAVEFLAPVI